MGKAWPQYALTIISNVGPLTFGLNVGWLSPYTEVLMNSTTTPLDSTLTGEDIAWLASMPTISMLVATPFFGWVLQTYGRKTACLFSNAPNLISFALYLIFNNYIATCIGRFIVGFASAGALVVTSVYVSECADDSRRGFLCGSSSVFINIGIVVALATGTYCSYFTANVVFLFISATFVIGYFWLPESPPYLVRKGKSVEAEKSLKKIRGCSKESALLEANRISIELKETAVRTGRAEIVKILMNGGLRKGFFIAFGLLTFQQMSGIPAFLNFMAHILRVAKCSPEPEFLTTFLGSAQLVTSLFGPLLLLYFGRRTILLSFAMLMTASLFLLCGYLYLMTGEPSFVPSVAFTIYVVSYNIGYGTVPFVLLPEVIPVESRGAVVGIVGTWVAVLLFLLTKYFFVMLEQFTIFIVFCIFAFFSLFGVIFIHFCVFETKGRSALEICDILNHGRMRNELRPVEPIRTTTTTI